MDYSSTYRLAQDIRDSEEYKTFARCKEELREEEGIEGWVLRWAGWEELRLTEPRPLVLPDGPELRIWAQPGGQWLGEGLFILGPSPLFTRFTGGEFLLSKSFMPPPQKRAVQDQAQGCRCRPILLPPRSM